MMNFRYHVVSLTAVFLALALGVIAGTTVIDQGIVKSIRALNIARTKTVNQLRDQVDADRRRLEVWEGFGNSVIPVLGRGLLTGRSVVVLTHDGAGDEEVDAVVDAVRAAGGTSPGRVVFSDRWRLEEDAATEQLSLALGLEGAPEALVRNAALQLGARLGAPADPRTPGDLLGALERAGFLSVASASGAPFPAEGSAFVFLWGGAAEPPPSPSPEDFVLPLLRVLGASAPTAAAEPLAADDSLIDRVRGDDELAARVATIDHGDTAVGRFALVRALHDLAAGSPASRYGIRRGATAVAPIVESP